MSSQEPRAALYYPFHLCHEQTLARLLERYSAVHFRDYMAVRLTPMSGLTAYMDRMGDRHPELVAQGRIVQGYDVSGPLDGEMSRAIDHDLNDPPWRAIFHVALSEDRRFQRGLFPAGHSMRLGDATIPTPAALLRLTEPSREKREVSLQTVRSLAEQRLGVEDAYAFEYGLALVKTAAALVYTIRLAIQHDLEPATDSEPHSRLLGRTLSREGRELSAAVITRQGY